MFFQSIHVAKIGYECDLTCFSCQKRAVFVAAGRALFHLLDNGGGEACEGTAINAINMYHVSLVPGRRRQSWSYTFVMLVSYLSIYFLFFDIVARAMPTKQSCSPFCGFQTALMPHH